MFRPLALAITARVGLAIASADLDAFAVPAFDFSSLNSEAQHILQALQKGGIISLKNAPNYVQLRESYLEQATQCALAAGASGDSFLQYKTLRDGTQRYTISTMSGKELSQAAEDTRTRCPGYVDKYRALSAAVEEAVAALGKALDATPFSISSHEKLSGSQLMSESVHLDHFHAYEASSATANADEELLSLELHTDNGILIAMTAPKYFDVSPASVVQAKTSAIYESGLLIENHAGKLVRPTLKEDELMLMVGAGFQEWIRTSPALRPVPHAMKYPRLSTASADDRLIRAWFGKMVLLSAEERLLNVDMKFGDFAVKTARFLMGHSEEDYGFASLACPHGRRLHESDKACAVKQCVPKAGKDPDLPCSIQCNMSPVSRPGADRLCEENCECTEKPGNTSATYCWMLCVEKLPEDECGSVGQRCKSGKEAPYIVDQAYVCNITSNSTSTGSVVATSPSTVPSPSSSPSFRSTTAAVASVALVSVLLSLL